MTPLRQAFLLIAAAGLSAAADLDHSSWEALTKHYVNSEARVDYTRWKQDGLGALDAYLVSLARAWPKGMSAESEKAAFINAYNALTVRWILVNYPVESVWQTSQPFTEARHTVNGEKTSLDSIEGRLRKLGDPRIHGALVCAARSCPPLRREAYTAVRLDAQLDANMRAWLANPKLNRFLPETRTAQVSEIFKWYQGDFTAAAGSVEKFLARFGPEGSQAFTLGYIPYNWGLNDSGKHGEGYKKR